MIFPCPCTVPACFAAGCWDLLATGADGAEGRVPADPVTGYIVGCCEAHAGGAQPYTAADVQGCRRQVSRGAACCV